MRVPLAFVALLSLAAAPPEHSPSPAEIRAATQTLLTAWADAQHRGDVAAYLAFYDHAHFTGQKRVTSGERKKYDYAAWARDRSRMLANHPDVAVEQLRVQSWRDPHSKLRPGVVRAHFVQRWRSPRYADHGPKIMQLYFDHGKLEILHEALLQSRPGWDRPPPAPTASAANMTALTTKSDGDALAAWHRLGLRGKNWEQTLAAIPDDVAVRRSLARALLAAGGYECKVIDNQGECGEDDWVWGPLPDDADIDNPCLRAHAAAWALAEGELTVADLHALWPTLSKIFAMDAPAKRGPAAHGAAESNELCGALLTATAKATDLRVAAIDAAVAQGCAASEAVQLVSSLPPAAKLALATLGNVEEALDAVDAKQHLDLLLAAIDNSALSKPWRLATIDSVARMGHSSAIKAALTKVAASSLADDDAIEVSARAGVALATLGDASQLAARPPSNDVATLERQLHRLRFDPDAARQQRLLRGYLFAPGDHAAHTITVVRAERHEYDGNTPVEERQEDTEETTKLDAAAMTMDDLGVFWDAGGEAKIELKWESSDDGTLLLVGIDITHSTFTGCPC